MGNVLVIALGGRQRLMAQGAMDVTDPTSIWAENDPRRYPRASWDGEAVLQCSGREFILTARNVSEGGMRAESEADLPVSTLGFVSFELKPGGLPLVCRCRVVYAIDGKGVGIEFLDVSDEARWTLKSFMDETN